MKKALFLMLGLLTALPVFGQTASRFDNAVYSINASAPLPGGFYPVLAYPGATIAVCTAPANAVPCTNYATTYTNAAEAGTCSAPTQLTGSNSTTCVGTADAEGGWGVWMATGTYQYTVTTVQGSYGPYDFSVGGGSGGGGSGTVTNFSAQATVAPLFTTSVSNPTTTPALSFTLSNFAAHSFYGNNTGSTGAPGASSIGASDWSVNAYAAGSGSAQAQTVTLVPAATSLLPGLEVRWLPLAANTGAGPTLNVNGLGARTLTKMGTTALVANDLTTTAVADAIYDANGNWELQNPQTGGSGGSCTGGDCILAYPSAPQSIVWGTNGVNSLTIANASGGSSAASLFNLSNGPDSLEIGILGTGTGLPGVGQIGLTTPNAELSILSETSESTVNSDLR